MKNLFLTLLLINKSLILFGQNDFYGTYKNAFGEKIKLNSDHTFEYTWKFDLSLSWNNGRWKIENGNYLILEVVEIRDSIKNGNEITLVLSSDTVSNEISNRENVMLSLSSVGQSRSLPPKKFKIINTKLCPHSKDNNTQDRKLKSILSTRNREHCFMNE